MHRLLAFLLATCWLACGSPPPTVLDKFYNEIDSIVDSTAFNATELCRLKWEVAERLFGRHGTNLSGRVRHTGTAKNVSILVVHVGKTGGGTIKEVFERKKMNFQQLHLHALDAAMVRDHDTVLLALRDPVDRLISAFNYRNTEKEHKEVQHGIGRWSEMHSCFRTLDAFADALTKNTNCGRVARLGEVHTEFGICAYLGGMEQELLRNRDKVFAIGTETLEDDLNVVSQLLGWKETFSNLPHTHDYEKPPNATSIRHSSLMKLRGYIEFTGEGDLYRRLEKQFSVHLHRASLIGGSGVS